MYNDKFLMAYVEALIWSTSDMDTGEPIECDWTDFNEGLKVRCKIDCQNFREMAGELLDFWGDEQAGHDFALTRNGHGTGFWDRFSLGCDGHEQGNRLTEICRKFGEINIYFGDDGLVYA